VLFAFPDCYNACMRRSIIAFLLLLTILSSVIALFAVPRLATPDTAGLLISTTSAPRASATLLAAAATMRPTHTANPLSPVASAALATPAATSTPLFPTPTASLSQGYLVRLHPDGPLYVGDLVSFEVIAPPDLPPQELHVQVDLPFTEEGEHPQAGFGPHGIGARQQADLRWTWDTSGLQPGSHEVGFSIVPGGPQWTETITLAPAGQLPEDEAAARWEQVSTECCKISYVSHTAAARDIEALRAVIDQQAQHAIQRLGITLEEPVEITLLPRVLGHGGFAGYEISVSYLDRDYMGGEKGRIIHHEIIHILDGRLGGELRPAMLVEGFAVYMSDGHFKAENLLPRAAALLPPRPGCVPWSPTASDTDQGCGLNQFIPLGRLIDNFYFEQHEVGYLESGALIAYMVERWGWPAFSAFYRDIHSVKAAPSAARPPGQHSYAVNTALNAHFGLDLAMLEQDFRRALENEHVSPREAEDLRLTLTHFDTARRYQALLDPSAHFLSAWLLDTREMRKRQISADYLRRRTAPENLALETMLVASGQSLVVGDYHAMARLLAAANRVLDVYPRDGLQAFAADPLAADYLALVQLSLSQGYRPEQITIENETARMAVSSFGPELIELSLARQGDAWLLLSSGSLFSWAGPYGEQVHRMPLSESNGGWQYRFR